MIGIIGNGRMGSMLQQELQKINKEKDVLEN